MSALLCLVVTLVCLAADSPAKDVLEGRVVAVQDGDTLTLLVDSKTVKVRLAGIDTPERGQPWAKRAHQALSDRVFRKEVRVNAVTIDRYGRTVGEVYADNVCVGCELVREGHAWVYRRYNEDPVLLELEQDAREARRGLWGLPESERVPPWEWRRRSSKGDRSPPVEVELDVGDFACGARKTCGEMRSCAEARFHHAECSLARLDGDGDGVPCEALCGKP
jgi:endonuclease YncB( thermonuclease family)